MSQTASQTSPSPGRRNDLLAIVLMAVSVFIMISLYSSASGIVGAVVSSWLRTALGNTALIPALFLFLYGVSVMSRRRFKGRRRRFVSITLAYLALLTGYHLLVVHSTSPMTAFWARRAGEEGGGAGWVGGVVAAFLLSAFGIFGSIVMLVALLLMAIVLFVDKVDHERQGFTLAPVGRALKRTGSGLWGFVTGVKDEMIDLAGILAGRRKRAVQRRTVDQPLHEDAETRPAKRRKKRRLIGRRKRRAAKRMAYHEQVAMQQAQPIVPYDQDRDVGAPLTDSYVQEDEPEISDAPIDANGQANDNDSIDPPVIQKNNRRTASPSRSAPAAKAPAPTKAAAVAVTNGKSDNPYEHYKLPSPSLLTRPSKGKRQAAEDTDQSELLVETLMTFGVETKIVDVSRGPVITRYELQPARGVKVSRIVNLADDLSLNLAAAGVRIEAPVPGKSVVGIEVPNKETSMVSFREMVESPQFQEHPSKIIAGLGKDIAGQPVIADMTKLLHLLIAGATGSGKSVCINTLICSILFKARPDEVKLLMIDPKRVELAIYDGIPHLISPVVTDPKLAANALKWAVKEMEERYKKFSNNAVRNIAGYNKEIERGSIDDDPMPYIAVIIDELADLMLVAGNEVEDSISRLAQMARAAGIHLVIATQRPSVDVITGLIKANVPSRLSFAVSSGIDSRTILDTMGAERLIGKGDMLYYPIGAAKPVRAQGAFISDREVQRVVEHCKNQAEPDFVEDVSEPEPTTVTVEEGDDELYDDAVRLIVEAGSASISMIQRRFRVGYARAARLIDMMELAGVVGPYQGSKPREVLKSIDDLEGMRQDDLEEEETYPSQDDGLEEPLDEVANS